MSVALTGALHQWSDTKRLHVASTIAFSGNYTTGGDTINFAAVDVRSSRPPTFISIPPVAGYIFEYVPGTSSADGKILVRLATDGSQLPGAAVPGALSSAAPTVYAIFHKFV